VVQGKLRIELDGLTEIGDGAVAVAFGAMDVGPTGVDRRGLGFDLDRQIVVGQRNAKLAGAAQLGAAHGMQACEAAFLEGVRCDRARTGDDGGLTGGLDTGLHIVGRGGCRGSRQRGEPNESNVSDKPARRCDVVR